MINKTVKKSSKFYSLYPEGIPKILIHLLLIVGALLGLVGLRESWYVVFENWLFMFLYVPTAIAVLTLPFKYRDPSFELKKTYYMGIFVALLYLLGKLRYLR